MRFISTKILGRKYEKTARLYLEQRGLKHIKSNYHSRFGEIDLIMHEADTLIFVEVRARSDEKFGIAYETVDRQKQQKIILTSKLFLVKYNNIQYAAVRYDIVSISGDNINWIKNAITLD